VAFIHLNGIFSTTMPRCKFSSYYQSILEVLVSSILSSPVNEVVTKFLPIWNNKKLSHHNLFCNLLLLINLESFNIYLLNFQRLYLLPIGSFTFLTLSYRSFFSLRYLLFIITIANNFYQSTTCLLILLMIFWIFNFSELNLCLFPLWFRFYHNFIKGHKIFTPK
jgi:hypothetical protein